MDGIGCYLCVFNTFGEFFLIEFVFQNIITPINTDICGCVTIGIPKWRRALSSSVEHYFYVFYGQATPYVYLFGLARFPYVVTRLKMPKCTYDNEFVEANYYDFRDSWLHGEYYGTVGAFIQPIVVIVLRFVLWLFVANERMRWKMPIPRKETIDEVRDRRFREQVDRVFALLTTAERAEANSKNKKRRW